MFPRAQTACSQTLAWLDSSSLTNLGTAPALTTAFVWSLVPEAMLVRAQAASNCSSGLKKLNHYVSSSFMILLITYVVALMLTPLILYFIVIISYDLLV